VELIAIDEELVEEVAQFLHRHLSSGRSIDDWRRAVRYPWYPERPNYGWALHDHGQVVGVICAIYSVQQINGRDERFCNIHSWCVRPDYRSESLRLLTPLLRQDEYTITNLTAGGAAVEIMRRMGFSVFDDKVVILPNPLLTFGAWHVQTTTQRDAVLSRVDCCQRRLLWNLGPMRKAVTTLAHAGDDWCLCISVRERRRGSPVTRALYVSHPPLWSAWISAFVRSFLKLDHTPVTTCSPRFFTRRPFLAKAVNETRPQFFRSRRLSAEHVTALYSELTR
jgi:hypothetical protein